MGRMLIRLIILILLTGLLQGCWIVETGIREGNIIKVADEGFFCKTHEIEIIKGGLSEGSGSFGVEPFNFTVESEEVLNTLKKAQNERKEVRVYYHREVISWCRTETFDSAFVDKVEILN